MPVTLTAGTASTTEFKDLEFGEVFLFNGLPYVKLRPAGARNRFNAVGLGHDSTIYLWHEVVQVLDAELSLHKEDES
jgi:hypothetical protein